MRDIAGSLRLLVLIEIRMMSSYKSMRLKHYFLTFEEVEAQIVIHGLISLIDV